MLIRSPYFSLRAAQQPTFSLQPAQIACMLHSTWHADAVSLHRYWNAIYVLFSYSARRSTAVSVQSLLSKPAVGSEKQILRFGTFRLA